VTGSLNSTKTTSLLPFLSIFMLNSVKTPAFGEGRIPFLAA